MADRTRIITEFDRQDTEKPMKHGNFMGLCLLIFAYWFSRARRRPYLDCKIFNICKTSSRGLCIVSINEIHLIANLNLVKVIEYLSIYCTVMPSDTIISFSECASPADTYKD